MEEHRKVIFGKYEMGRLLGKGTFAKVYHARNLVTGEGVAIKIICKDELKKIKGMMEQVKREISIMKLVKNPNVVDLKEVMATKSKIYFVMEYVKGGELFAKVARGKLKEDDARRYFQQLISAVEYCHSCGVSHRDLKPENLLLDENGDLKISDFGLSALPEQVKNDGLHTRCGTPAYLAPEVLKFKGYDGAEGDVWSCGVVLYVLLAGFLPFDDENMIQMYKRITTAKYDTPPWFSNQMKRVIGKLLVVNPKKRVDIPTIMRMPWFKKGFEPGKGFGLDDLKKVKALDFDDLDHDEDKSLALVKLDEQTKKPLPDYYNAFELISSMASGLDLSGLFEKDKRKDVGSVFTSKHSASEVVEEIAGSARRSGWKVGKKKEFKLKIEGGQKGKMGVTAEVFDVAPHVTMVEFEKSISGDALEFNKFLDEVRPALKDIVWTWQGDDHDQNSAPTN